MKHGCKSITLNIIGSIQPQGVSGSEARLALTKLHQCIILTQILNKQTFFPLNGTVSRTCFHLIVHLSHNSQKIINDGS